MASFSFPPPNLTRYIWLKESNSQQNYSCKGVWEMQCVACKLTRVRKGANAQLAQHFLFLNRSISVCIGLCFLLLFALLLVYFFFLNSLAEAFYLQDGFCSTRCIAAGNLYKFAMWTFALTFLQNLIHHDCHPAKKIYWPPPNDPTQVMFFQTQTVSGAAARPTGTWGIGIA